jgi:hypothetical protein
MTEPDSTESSGGGDAEAAPEQPNGNDEGAHEADPGPDD